MRISFMATPQVRVRYLSSIMMKNSIVFTIIKYQRDIEANYKCRIYF